MLAFVFCRPKKFVKIFGFMLLGLSFSVQAWLSVLSAKTQKEIVCYSLRDLADETVAQASVKRDPASQNPFPKLPSNRNHVLCIERYDLQRFPRSVVRFVLIEETESTQAPAQKSKVVARRYYHLMVPDSENRKTASAIPAPTINSVEEYGIHQPFVRINAQSKIIELLFLNNTLPQKFRYNMVDSKKFYSHLNRYHQSAAERVISSE